MMKNFLFLLLLSLWVPETFADHHRGKTPQGMDNPAKKSLSQSNKPAPMSRPGISNKRAASLVMEQYSGSRILGVSLMDEQGPAIYKVRTLSPQGVVRSVFVDGHSGEVFE